MKRKDFEVMAPVGSYESLEAALQAGANSVYFGVEGLNMRSRSSANFTLDDLRNIVERCNAREVKTYLTVNTIIYNNELEKMYQVIECAKDAGVSAIIASDIAAILYARSIGVEVHISTQCNITNYEAVKFYAQFADVVVLARELDMDQVMTIHRQIVENDLRGPKGELVQIEMFSHGALCMAVSGKCYLSLHEMNASANRGGNTVDIVALLELLSRALNLIFCPRRHCNRNHAHQDDHRHGKSQNRNDPTQQTQSAGTEPNGDFAILPTAHHDHQDGNED